MSQLKAIKQNPMYRFLMVLTISSTVGLQTWRTLFDNFAVRAAGLDGNHIGVIQSVREIPGFLALLAVFAIMLIKEHRLADSRTSPVSIIYLGSWNRRGGNRPVSFLFRPSIYHPWR